LAALTKPSRKGKGCWYARRSNSTPCLSWPTHTGRSTGGMKQCSCRSRPCARPGRLSDEATVGYRIGRRLLEEARYSDAAAEFEWARNQDRAGRPLHLKESAEQRCLGPLPRAAEGRVRNRGSRWPRPRGLASESVLGCGPVFRMLLILVVPDLHLSVLHPESVMMRRGAP
jgi:hypothetical protein